MYKYIGGGSWINDNPANFRCAYRYRNESSRRNVNLSFRLSARNTDTTKGKTMTLYAVTTLNLLDRSVVQDLYSASAMRLFVSSTLAEQSGAHTAKITGHKQYVYVVNVNDIAEESLAYALASGTRQDIKSYTVGCIKAPTTTITLLKTYRRVTRKYDIEVTEA